MAEGKFIEIVEDPDYLGLANHSEDFFILKRDASIGGFEYMSHVV